MSSTRAKWHTPAKPRWRFVSADGFRGAQSDACGGKGHRDFLNHILISHGFRKSALADKEKNFIVDKDGQPEEAAIRIHQCEGFDNLPRALKAEFQPDSLDGLAIVADMDRHDDRRWPSLRGTLASHGYIDLPDALPTQGLVPPTPDLSVRWRLAHAR